MLIRRAFFSLVLLLASAWAAAAELRLVMVEEMGCMWCQRWDEEISEIYPKTAEGQAAPLMRIEIDGPRPEGMQFARRLTYTPTFVLMRDGVEVSRIEGYPGEDFFWGFLEQMLIQADNPVIN